MQNATILLIENSAEQARIIQRLLASSGITRLVHTADPDQAMNLLAENKLDMILVDISLALLRDPDWMREHQSLVPIVILTDQKNERLAMQAISVGAQDYLIREQLTAPLLKNAVHYAINRARLLASNARTQEHFERVIEDQKILHRIDRELGYTLNPDHVLHLAMDTALRLTAAAACVVGWIEEETQQLEKLASLGIHTLLMEPVPVSQLDQHPLIGRVFSEDDSILIETGKSYSQVAIPLMVQGKPSGLLLLENVPNGVCDQSDWDFLVHLANRTATALEKARIYQRTQYQAVQIDKLYELSTEISRHLDRQEVMQASATALVSLLQGSSALFCEYVPRFHNMVVCSVYVAQEASDNPPLVGTVFAMNQYPHLQASLNSMLVQIRQNEQEQTEEISAFLDMLGVQAALLIPLLDQGNLIGMLVLCESNFDRHFTSDEISLARSLGGSTTVALNKATLFDSVQQLEQMKSEMLQMASHDLRTPLSRIVFSLALLEPAVEPGSNQAVLLEGVREATQQMHTLLEDLLNLNRIESEEMNDLKFCDVTALLDKVIGEYRSQADIKQQHYQVDIPAESIMIYGSDVHLQQAFANYVGNALKYTPEGGTIMVRARTEDGRFIFEVQDTGYGIPKDKQAAIFGRFFRAHTPGTEDIPGTGLGLSLVKTVIERHGGKVWFHSEVNKGSIFGLWLPLTNS